jgi:hypothetical protein
MNVLVINCGSSSLKYQLIDSETEAVLAKGLCERIGIDGRLVYQKTGLDKEITEAAMPTHKQAIQMVLDAIVNPKTGALKSLAEVDAVGHRVVHGGEKFASSVVLTEEVLAQIEECNDLAPLHNPANLIGIRACQELQEKVRKAAEKLQIPLQEGVYMQFTGPSYETPAEIRMCRTWGGDAAGMSTACEAVAANHMGMKVCGISCITNLAAGMSKQKLDHKEVQETADRVSRQFKQLVTEVIRTI